MGCRIARPSPKNGELRYGFIFGWSCMSCRQAPPTRQTPNSKTTIPSCFLNLDIANFDRPKTLQQIRHRAMVELRVIRLHREKESIPRGECKIRQVENRMIRLRELVQDQHSQHRGEGREQNRHFKSDRNKRGPTVVRLAAHIDRIIDHLDPVLHEKAGQPANHTADKNDQRQTRVREANRLRKFFNRKRRVAINPAVSRVVNFARRVDQIVRVLKLRQHAIKRRRMTSMMQQRRIRGHYSSTSASGRMVRISKIEIIGRNLMNRNSSVKKKPSVPMNMPQSHCVGWYMPHDDGR